MKGICAYFLHAFCSQRPLVSIKSSTKVKYCSF